MHRHHACAFISIVVSGLALGACSIGNVHFLQQADAQVESDTAIDAPPGNALGVVTTPTMGLEVTEGSTTSFTVRLTTQPAAATTVMLDSSNPLAATIVPTTLTFTPSNWNIDQPVTVSGLDDANTTNELSNVAITSSGLADIALAITVFDDDVLVIDPSSTNLGSLNEGTTNSFTVRLSHLPPADITVAVTSSNVTAVAVTPSNLTFTTANWATPQTVDATLAQDLNAANETATISLVATGLMTRTVAIAVTDDDVQAITAAPSPLTIAEGANGTLDVRLAYQPAGDVTVSTSSLDPSIATIVVPTSLTFSPANYDTPQTVTLTGVEDTDAAPETSVIRLESTATGLVTDVPVNVIDNDTLAIDLSSTTVSLTEGGSTTFQVRLTAMPLSAVTVIVNSGDTNAATVSPSSLSFTPANWDTYQTATVHGTEDVNLAAESVTITMSASGFSTRTVTATVSDNDDQQIVASAANVTVSEGGTGTVGVSLMFQPTASVTVNVISNSTTIATVSAATLTFTSANYATPQNVTITGAQDANARNDSTTISFTAAATTAAAVTVNVSDDDILAIQTDIANVSVNEGGTATFKVRLSAQPAATTTITLASNDTGTATVSPVSLSFTTTNFGTFQTVTVTGVEDADAAPEAAAILLSASGLGNINVGITVTDNDTLAVATTTGTVSLGEAGASSFGIHLTAMPAGNITVSVTSSDNGAATTSPAALTFTPSNWNIDQTVTVTGVADADVANETVSITCSSSGLPDRVVTATVNDDDTQAIVVSAANVTVSEGGTGTVGVSLMFQPTASVTVNAISNSTTIATVSAATLTFTPANYATPQNVTVTGAQDANARNDSTTISFTAAAATAAAVTVNVSDDDILAIQTDIANVSVNEGGTATFKVRLSAQPAITTTVLLASNDASAATVNPASLSFTAANFDTFQTVTVTGVEDADAIPETAAIILSATGLANVNVGVSVTDNDTLAIATTTGAVSLGEAGASSFGVHLTAMPASNITVAVASSDTGAAAISPASLTFTTTNWDTDQTVTVMGMSDADLANETVSITCSSSGLTNRVVIATVNDDDIQEVLITPTSLTVNEGLTTSFNVKLRFIPSSNTTVTVVSNNPSIATVSTAALSFTPTNYDIPQTVIVTGVNDANASNESTTITASASGATSGTVNLTVTDDDTLAIATTTGTISLGEADATNFGVHLTAMPTGNVTVNVASSDIGAAMVSSTALTFTPANWNIDQTVTVAGVADLDLVNETVSITCGSSGLTNRVVIATVNDDDIQEVLVTPTSLTVNEGLTASFNVKLRFIPSSNTTVTVVSNSPSIATVSTTALSFTPTNYDIPQTVIVTGVNDANASNESTTITASASSAIDGTVNLTVVDDDTLSIVVSTTTLTVSEIGSGTFKVRLGAQPAGNIVVSLSSNDVGAANISPSSLTFTTANWNVDQTVTVAGIDDTDLSHETVTITLASAPLTSKQVIVSVADDDLLSVSPQNLLICAPGSRIANVSLGGPPFGGPVTVSVSSGQFVSTNPSSLLFTASGTLAVTVDAEEVSSSQSSSVTISGPLLTSRVIGVTIRPANHRDCVGTTGCGDGVCSFQESLDCSCPLDCTVCR